MRIRSLRRLLVRTFLGVVAAAGFHPVLAQSGSTPGETSGDPLSPLVVTSFDRVSGDLRLSYQTGCGTTDNNIYYGPLGQVSTLNWTGEVCGIGRTGTYDSFDPGPGSWFFIIAGNDGSDEGSYGKSRLPSGTRPERRPFLGNDCGVVQDLTDACAPAAAGPTCSSSLDCPSRQTCVMGSAAVATCVCLPPFAGPFCAQCSTGYTGPDCRGCASGFISNAMQNAAGDDLSEDLTSPDQFRCHPGVPASCAGRSCSGHGTCTQAGQDAICACAAGYAGGECEQCAPNYQRNATGECVLGLACRTAKCGGHGACVSTPYGEVTCACDPGYRGVDCGGPDFAIRTDSERSTLYDAETIVLHPHGGGGPFTWQVVAGPARVVPCGTSSPSCPPGSAEFTVLAPPGGIQDLTLVTVALFDAVGNQAAMNLAALPSTVLPFTGSIRSELFPYYRAMLKYMRARGIRAGVLSISKAGVVIGSNGYGYRDARIDGDPFVNAGEVGPLVMPDSPFRIASVTKTLAAAAVRQTAAAVGVDITSNSAPNRAATWIQNSIGFSLTGGAPPFDYNLAAPLTTDARWSNVTIQHLMNHHAGFFRDVVPPSTTGQPAYDGTSLPFTQDPNTPNGLQNALSGTSADISYATSYATAALQLIADPRITVDRMIRFAAGMQLHYNPGGSTAGGDAYSNIGYIMLGRVLEGLRGETYDRDEPGVPMGWGAFPTLLQDYLCETSGIATGIYPGNAFQPQPLEPYYRSLNWQGIESRSWNIAEGSDKIRFNAGIGRWQFCQSGCPAQPGAVWNEDLNTPTAYGGFWLAERNSAGGIVATAPALLKFARNHRIKVGSTGDGATGIGSLLAAPGSYGSSSSHNGSLSGTRSWLWQMGGARSNNVPFDLVAWNDDPAAPLDLDGDGAILINEATIGFNCNIPSDVAVAVMFNQREDRRAPSSNVSSQSNSSSSTVWGRIIDYLGDATCQVAAQGWPAVGDPPPVLLAQPLCN